MSSTYSGTQYGDISPRVGVVAVAEMLAIAQSILVLEKMGKTYALPKNKGLILRWRRPVPFAVADTTLTEGVTPAPQILEYEDLEVQIAQYGAWVAFTDVIQDTHEDPNLKVMSELCGKQAGDTKEAIIWGVIRAGTAVIYSGVATSRATVTAPLAYEDIASSIRELKANHAKKITKVLKAGTGIATEPVQAAYVLVSHTDTEFDFRNMDTFISAEKYGSGSVIDPNEIGSVGQVRIILSPHLEPFYGAGSATITGVLNNGTNVDVYCSVILAEDAFAVTPLAGMTSAAMAVTNPKMGTPGDELGQRGSVAWKMWYAAKILNDNWMVRLEHAVTAL
jgi:N4-gp56 family major capsid protein